MNKQHSFQVDQVTKESPKAVVLLLGWWGASTRHLDKYAQVYRDNNCLTVQAIGDKYAVLTHDNESLDDCIKIAVAEVAKLLLALDREVPVLVHCFSNGGAYLLERLEKLIQKARATKASSDFLLVGKRMKGQIFDSSPAFPSVQAATEAMAPVFPNIVAQLIIGFLFHINAIMNQLLKFVSGKKTDEELFWKHMLSTDLCKNQAFIYSSLDTITNTEKLEELITNRRKINEDTRILKFEDSLHVQHLRKHPKAYVSFVQESIHGLSSAIAQ